MRIASIIHQLTDLAGEDGNVFLGHEHFVIDDSIIEMMDRTDVADSIRAMVEADVCHLPFPTTLIEFQSAEGARRFVLLTEQGQSFSAKVAVVYRNQMATVSSEDLRLNLHDASIKIEGASAGYDGVAAGLGLAMALLLLNTQGIARDVIDPVRFNRARRMSGKGQSQRHTLLRIGTVYDREGRAACGGGVRAPMRVHFRHGHVRQQACGPNRADRVAKYIPPVLVNYRPGGDMPDPKIRVVAR